MAKYATQNLYEAAFLMAQGFNLSGKEALGNKVTILFEKHPRLEVEAMKYYNRGKVEAKKYSDSYRTLKDYVFTR